MSRDAEHRAAHQRDIPQRDDGSRAARTPGAVIAVEILVARGGEAIPAGRQIDQREISVGIVVVEKTGALALPTVPVWISTLFSGAPVAESVAVPEIVPVSGGGCCAAGSRKHAGSPGRCAWAPALRAADACPTNKRAAPGSPPGLLDCQVPLRPCLRSRPANPWGLASPRTPPPNLHPGTCSHWPGSQKSERTRRRRSPFG